MTSIDTERRETINGAARASNNGSNSLQDLRLVIENETRKQLHLFHGLNSFACRKNAKLLFQLDFPNNQKMVTKC